MRILIKISGEALSHGKTTSVDQEYVRKICSQIHVLVESGIEVALVCGGGNICRGEIFAKDGISPNTAHEIGMLSTVINGLILQDSFIALGQDATLYTAREISTIGEVFNARKAQKELTKKTVVIASGGS